MQKFLQVFVAFCGPGIADGQRKSGCCFYLRSILWSFLLHLPLMHFHSDIEYEVFLHPVNQTNEMLLFVFPVCCIFSDHLHRFLICPVGLELMTHCVSLGSSGSGRYNLHSGFPIPVPRYLLLRVRFHNKLFVVTVLFLFPETMLSPYCI